jgi:hypothetical protein
VNAHLTRNARAWLSRWLIASLLFLQLASSAYACAMSTAGAAAASMAGMPCAELMGRDGMAAMDPDQPGLCLEHCKGGSPTLEPGSATGVVPPTTALPFVAAAPAELAGMVNGWRARARSHGGAPPPPHAILHCCFRI